MSTRLDLRTSLRQRLEDLNAAPLWDDGALNEAITAATLRYGTAIPAERTLALTVAANAQSIALPGNVESARIRFVIDPEGGYIPRQRLSPGGADATGTAQSWRSWGGVFYLERPARGGAWRIEYHASRSAPTDDITALDVAPGDEELVLALAMAQALERRIVADGKRGSASTALGSAATAAECEAAWLLRQRRRAVRSRWLG